MSSFADFLKAVRDGGTAGGIAELNRQGIPAAMKGTARALPVPTERPRSVASDIANVGGARGVPVSPPPPPNPPPPPAAPSAADPTPPLAQPGAPADIGVFVRGGVIPPTGAPPVTALPSQTDPVSAPAAAAKLGLGTVFDVVRGVGNVLTGDFVGAARNVADIALDVHDSLAGGGGGSGTPAQLSPNNPVPYLPAGVRPAIGAGSTHRRGGPAQVIPVTGRSMYPCRHVCKC